MPEETSSKFVVGRSSACHRPDRCTRSGAIRLLASGTMSSNPHHRRDPGCPSSGPNLVLRTSSRPQTLSTIDILERSPGRSPGKSPTPSSRGSASRATVDLGLMWRPLGVDFGEMWGRPVGGDSGPEHHLHPEAPASTLRFRHLNRIIGRSGRVGLGGGPRATRLAQYQFRRAWRAQRSEKA